MDGEDWKATVHGVAKIRTQLRDFTFTFHFHALEKEMATHSSVFAWSPRDGGAWWAAVYGVTQSWTWLKQLSSSSSSSKGKVHSNTGIPQETRKKSNNLTLHLKQLEKEELENPRVSRRKIMFKIMVKINAKETRNQSKNQQSQKLVLWKDK